MFPKLHSLLATFVNTQEIFHRDLNVAVRVIWRWDVGQYRIDVETMLCMSTSKFTTLNNVKSTLSVSTLILTTLYNVETMLLFSTSSFITLINVKTTLLIWQFSKNWKEQKNIFELEKRRWLIWLTILAFDCDRLKRKRNMEGAMKNKCWKV